MKRQRSALGPPPRHMLIALLAAHLVTPCFLTETAVAADPSWTDSRQLGPFACQATFSLAEFDRVLAELPELQRELSRTLGIPPAQQPIHIYLFADSAEHKQFLTSRYPLVPYRRALFVKVDGRMSVYAYRQPELDIDLRHECTHAILHSVLPDVPLWLDEGLAEYFEMPPGQRAFDHPHLDALRWNIRLRYIRSVQTLETREQLSDMAATDYRYAWAWVHFMLHGPEAAHHALVGQLADMRQGKVGQPLSARLNTALPNPTDRLVEHFKNWTR